MKSIPRWQVLTDELLQNRLSHSEIARQALLGGAPAIQFREKRNLSADMLVAYANSLRAVCQELGGVPIINDRVDVASAAGVPNVHLGRSDISASAARTLLGESALIGRTANSLAEAKQADALPVDYLGVGPVYGTRSKAHPAPKLGISGLRRICAGTSLPVIAIGGIEPDHVEEILEAGAWGFAVLGGVACAPDVQDAAARYADAVGRWLDCR